MQTHSIEMAILKEDRTWYTSIFENVPMSANPEEYVAEVLQGEGVDFVLLAVYNEMLDEEEDEEEE